MNFDLLLKDESNYKERAYKYKKSNSDYYDTLEYLNRNLKRLPFYY